ncbi:MAG: UbiH/UbiF family hydroxylase [Burkholderiales bacterium]|jgi:ubiquinone biosynthesis UbiH/UbiF/VisC/COQ6 family hydroxylase
MSAAPAERDVIIVGAGLVGLALATALAHAGLKVALADRGNVAAAPRDGDGGAWDQRVYAISPGSASFLHRLGAWQPLPVERIAPIEAMDVRGDAGGRIEFSAYALGERALAWIVENRELNAALVQAARESPGLDIVAPCAPAAIAWRAGAAELRLEDGRTLSARLIVGADGVRSWTREQAGMRAVPRAYGQAGVVANFDTERAHRGRAFQWFLPDGGVLAWLPLPGRRVSIVWSAPAGLAAELMTLDATELAARVAAAGGHELGALTAITPAASFELTFLQLPTVIGDRLALVGDAAHGVHPLAGQGVNLGFGDAATLAAVLAARGAVADAGAGILLERYARRRAGPVLAMQSVTDGLVRLFDVRTPWLRALRNRGMRAVDALTPLKRLLAQPALR